jgi:hypothetical protein
MVGRSGARKEQPNPPKAETTERPNAVRPAARPPSRRGPERRILAGALALLALATPWYVLRPREPDLRRVANLGASGEVVVFFGDSTTQGYREVAERHGALLVEDILEGILGKPDLKVDPIHPNARGHRMIADRVVTVLRPLLREADRRRGLLGRSLQDSPLLDSRGVDTLVAS